jgi:multisubunit Na+/H+ antiporter MnhB subunit
MCDKPYTSNDKWTISIVSGLLFLVIGSPYTYNLTNSVTKRFGLTIADSQGCPNLAGILVHGIVFVLLLRFMMEGKTKAHNCLKPYTSKDKWIVSMVGGLLFLLIGSPFLYEAVDSLTSSFGMKIADSNGCPNLGGMMLHSAVYMSVVRLLMR